MLTKKKALEALIIDEKINKCPIELFKNDTVLIYLGRCRKSNIISANNECWVGKDKIYSRQFGYIYSFIIEKKNIYTELKVGDIIYCDPYVGEIMPFEIENELLYFKVIKLSEINIKIN